jgi:hypothetical protein
MKKNISLYEQAIIEEKRRKIQSLKGDFDIRKKYSDQIKILLPEITWKEKQLKYINARQLVKWYLGGYKSGKTFTGIALDIWLAYINRPQPGILVHQTMDGNEITIIPLIQELCNKNGIYYEVKKMRTKFKVVFKFGTTSADWGHLILASGDRPESLKGPKLAFGHIDEPFIQKEEISEVVLSRLAESRAKLRMLQYTGTPEPEHMSWGFDIVDKEFEDNDERFITTVSTREVAEYLAPGYIQDMERNLSPEKVQTFIDGKYRNLSQGKVYSSFDRAENVKHIDLKYFDDKADTEMVIGFDFNVNQMSAALYFIHGRMKYQMREYRIRSRSNTKEICMMIIQSMREEKLIKKNGYTKFGRSIIITGDAAGKAHSTKSNKSDYEIILREFENEDIQVTMYVPDSNPAVRDRVNYVNMQFENKTLVINYECKTTIRDRELTSWKMGADGFFIDKSKAELTHLSDAADYSVWNTQQMTSDEDKDEGKIWVELRGR